MSDGVITMHGQLVLEPAGTSFELVPEYEFSAPSRAADATTITATSARTTAVPCAPRPWARRISLLFFVVVGGALFMNRGSVAGAMHQMRSLSFRSLAGLLALVVLHKLCNITMQSASVPDVSFGRMALATEAYVGASNSVIGGASIGTGLKAAMLRSWRVAPIDIAVSVVATALAPSFAMWSIAFAHTVPVALSGHADRMERLTIAASIVALVGPATFWWLALRRPEVLAAVGRTVAAGRALLVAVLPIGRFADSAAARFDVPQATEAMRCRGRALAKQRGAVMLLAAVGGQLMLALLLLGCVRALGPTGSAVDALVVLRAFALLRVLSSFVPLPGGIGVLDLGLLGVLVSGGVSRPTALAAIGLYRALTFFLPMFTGAVCTAVWRTRRGRRHRAAALRVG